MTKLYMMTAACAIASLLGAAQQIPIGGVVLFVLLHGLNWSAVCRSS
jgi:hypothetical protein